MAAAPVKPLELSQELLDAIASRVRSEVDSALKRRAKRMALLVTSGEVDKLMVAATVAVGAAAMDFDVEVFFAFWGLSAVRAKSVFEGKRPVDQLLTAMLGSGLGGLPASRFNFCGLGARFLEQVMKGKKVASLEELMAMAEESGVRMTACQMSMDVMGIKREELRPGVGIGGVAAFLANASQCGTTLTI
jgi:peroxiredoxin family protein